MSVTMIASTNGSLNPTSETVVKNRPGGVDQPLTKVHAAGNENRRAPYRADKRQKSADQNSFQCAYPFYSMISSLSSGSVNGTGFGSVWYQYATDV